MKTEISKQNKIFENIKKVDSQGKEFWSARDLQILLGYVEWRNFERTIKDALISCKNASRKPEDHFVEANKTIDMPKGATKEIDDYKLTRYACYLIAQNGDPTKETIALAQTYFALKTRQSELDEKQKGELARIEARDELTNAEKKFNDTLYQREVNGKGIGIIRAKGDKILFGNFTTSDMKRKLEIKNSEPLADYLPTVTIGAKIFAHGMTVHNAETKNLMGELDITQEHVLSNQAVRTTLLGRGIKPELLPKEESVKKVKRKYKNILNQRKVNELISS